MLQSVSDDNHKSSDGFTLTPLATESIWNELRSGSKKALGILYEFFFNKLFNYGKKLTSDAGTIEDCIQELFIELWVNHGSLSEVKYVRSYLYKAFRRKLIHKLSIDNRVSKESIEDSFSIELSHKSHYLDDQINFETKQQFASILATLSARQKEALFLIYYDGMPYEEAAALLDLKVKTLYNQVHIAISKLRQQKASLALLRLIL